MEFAMELITNALGNEWVQYVTAAVAVFSAISAVTPTPEPGTWRAKMYKVVDWISLNVGKAKDKGDK